MQRASDFKVHLPITVLPLGGRIPDGQSACGSALHIPARKTHFNLYQKAAINTGLSTRSPLKWM
jgi:hypothetical protein